MSQTHGFLNRVAAILEAVSSATKGATLTSVLEASGLPKSTAHRTMNALVDIGFLETKMGGRRYYLGEKLLRLLHFGCGNDLIGKLVEKPLQEMADSICETTILSRLRSSSIEIAVARTPKDCRAGFIQLPLGPTPLHACSTAKSILAFQPDEVVERFLTGGFAQFTRATRVSRAAILEELESVRAQGYAICDQEIDLGIYSIALPVQVPRLGVAYSIAIAGPAERMRQRPTAEYVQLLKRSETKIKAILGETWMDGLSTAANTEAHAGMQAPH